MHGVEYNLRAKSTTKRSSFIVIVMIIINVIRKRLVISFLSSKFFCRTAWNGTKKEYREILCGEKEILMTKP